MTSAFQLVAVTRTHIFHGTALIAKRLQDVLNGPMSDYLELTAVSTMRLRNPGVVVSSAKEVAIIKDTLVAVFIVSDEHEAPRDRLNNHANREQSVVTITAASVEISGLVHLAGYFPSAKGILANGLTNFFPVTEASVCFAGVEDSANSTPVVLVNRTHLTSLAIPE